MDMRRLCDSYTNVYLMKNDRAFYKTYIMTVYRDSNLRCLQLLHIWGCAQPTQRSYQRLSPNGATQCIKVCLKKEPLQLQTLLRAECFWRDKILTPSCLESNFDHLSWSYDSAASLPSLPQVRNKRTTPWPIGGETRHFSACRTLK